MLGEISWPKKIGVPRRICDRGTGSGAISFVHSATMLDAEESAETVHPWSYLSEIFAYKSKAGNSVNCWSVCCVRQSVRYCLPSSVVSHLHYSVPGSYPVATNAALALLPDLTRLHLFYDYTRIYYSWMCYNYANYTGTQPFQLQLV